MSSYIAFDLDALNVVPDVASACGLPAGDVAHGLLKLWAWCFRHKTDVVTEIHLAGFFGKPSASALEAFGFLERTGSSWRVKGASRYLRVADGRRRGGLASKANLVPGGRKPAERDARLEPRSSREPAENIARLDLGLSPNTDDRTPTTEHRTPNTNGHALQAVWNDHKAATMPHWTATSAKRRKHADARMAEHSIEVLTEAVQRLAASDFASGRGGKWAATPDWLIESPGNVIKALEGNYDNRPGPTLRTAVAQSSDWSSTPTGVTVEDTF